MIQSSAVRNPDNNADVIVVGAGPAGSTAATYLARSGVDVLLLEKATFPRDKVCGDGLTPRGVKQVLALGIDVSGSDWLIGPPHRSSSDKRGDAAAGPGALRSRL